MSRPPRHSTGRMPARVSAGVSRLWQILSQPRHRGCEAVKKPGRAARRGVCAWRGNLTIPALQSSPLATCPPGSLYVTFSWNRKESTTSFYGKLPDRVDSLGSRSGANRSPGRRGRPTMLGTSNRTSRPPAHPTSIRTLPANTDHRNRNPHSSVPRSPKKHRRYGP